VATKKGKTVATIAIDGGFYNEESHGYYDPKGKFVPSATQILQLVGLSDYSMVPPEVLENKRRIGSEVHDLCASIDKYGDIDPSWVSEECFPYVKAYQCFRHDHNFEPEVELVEKPIIVSVHGMLYGVTPDAPGKLRGMDATLERKCVEAAQASWAVQTALQEFARYRTSRCGRSQRFALQLKKDGSYRINPHTNHNLDESRAIAFLTTVYARLDAGQKLWEIL
jgi:hypothetical protein